MSIFSTWSNMQQEQVVSHQIREWNEPNVNSKLMRGEYLFSTLWIWWNTIIDQFISVCHYFHHLKTLRNEIFKVWRSAIVPYLTIVSWRSAFFQTQLTLKLIKKPCWTKYWLSAVKRTSRALFRNQDHTKTAWFF